jgi:hypothetical protein
MFKHASVKKRVVVGYDIHTHKISDPLATDTERFRGWTVKQMKKEGWEVVHQWQQLDSTKMV